MYASSSTSHMPRSIFPDIPASRRAATASPDYSDNTAPGARPVSARRHTSATLPVRREARPLRSSPLAGPSLALTRDGTIAEEKAPLHVAFASDVSSEVYAADTIVESPVNDLASPQSSSSGHALSAPEPHSTRIDSPLDASSVPSRIRRFSLNLKRRSSSALSTRSEPHAAVPKPRNLSFSSSHSHSIRAAPPVPEMPQWARGGDQSRLAVAHSITSVDPPSKRHSAVLAHLPSTSRNPEENWLTSASAPRFSRLSLKAEGVVMPVSVKAARRRSTASVASHASADTVSGSVKGKQSARSLRSVDNISSETARRMEADAEMQPPRPLFRADTNTSSSSLGSSTADTDSIMTELRPVSRLSSMTDGEQPHVYSPESTAKSASTLELRINDVTIDMINYQPPTERIVSSRVSANVESVRIIPAITDGGVVKGVSEDGQLPSTAKVKRRGTLKKVWKRVVKSVKG
ncbi:hypothetical protein BC835DRAFT_1331675 [Cytidiella melzeri]|nr:hypothetical protein BC835DRAFT_1331675 [Cytidiella melzeri]